MTEEFKRIPGEAIEKAWRNSPQEIGTPEVPDPGRRKILKMISVLGVTVAGVVIAGVSLDALSGDEEISSPDPSETPSFPKETEAPKSTSTRRPTPSPATSETPQPTEIPVLESFFKGDEAYTFNDPFNFTVTTTTSLSEFYNLEHGYWGAYLSESPHEPPIFYVHSGGERLPGSIMVRLTEKDLTEESQEEEREELLPGGLITIKSDSGEELSFRYVGRSASFSKELPPGVTFRPYLTEKAIEVGDQIKEKMEDVLIIQTCDPTDFDKRIIFVFILDKAN